MRSDMTLLELLTHHPGPNELKLLWLHLRIQGYFHTKCIDYLFRHSEQLH